MHCEAVAALPFQVRIVKSICAITISALRKVTLSKAMFESGQ